MEASPKKRGRKPKAKALTESAKLVSDEVIDAGFIPSPVAKLARPKSPVQAMGFFKEAGQYYWAHYLVEDGKAIELDRGPGDIKANVIADFKIQVAKQIFAKEFE